MAFRNVLKLALGLEVSAKDWFERNKKEIERMSIFIRS
jgi:hypothetical protein